MFLKHKKTILSELNIFSSCSTPPFTFLGQAAAKIFIALPWHSVCLIGVARRAPIRHGKWTFHQPPAGSQPAQTFPGLSWGRGAALSGGLSHARQAPRAGI